jgi:hypothetical protein
MCIVWSRLYVGLAVSYLLSWFAASCFFILYIEVPFDRICIISKSSQSGDNRRKEFCEKSSSSVPTKSTNGDDSARTFMRASHRRADQCSDVKHIGSGKYFHLGMRNALDELVRGFTRSDFQQREGFALTIDISVYVDGVVRFKSARGLDQFWPILVSLNNVTNEWEGSLDKEIEVVGFYYGRGKPADCEAFLKDLLDELEELGIEDTGLLVGDERIPVKLDALIADHQGRCFLKSTKSSAGYSACERCELRGESYDRTVTTGGDPNIPVVRQSCKSIIYPTNSLLEANTIPQRTNNRFREQSDSDHHRGPPSPLLRLMNIDMVFVAPLEYMHMVCLGVMKRALDAMFEPRTSLERRRTDFAARHRRVLSDVHASFAEWCPMEFQRKPAKISDRGLSWKATQYRQVVCYTIAPLLIGCKNIAAIADSVIDIFLMLFCGIRILCDANLCQDDAALNEAKDYLLSFVYNSPRIFGKGFPSFNVHSLTHLADEVKRRRKALDSFSAFPSESYFGRMMKLVGDYATHLPGEQLVMRLWEIRQLNLLNNATGVIRRKKLAAVRDIQLTHPIGKSGRRFSRAIFPRRFTLSSTTQDSFCSIKVNESLRLVKCVEFSIAQNGCLTLHGYEILTSTEEFFSFPTKASRLGIRVVPLPMRTEVASIQEWQLNQVVHKLFILPVQSRNSFVAIPLLHIS